MLSSSRAFPPILIVTLVVCIGECYFKVKSPCVQRSEIFYGIINLNEDLRIYVISKQRAVWIRGFENVFAFAKFARGSCCASESSSETMKP